MTDYRDRVIADLERLTDEAYMAKAKIDGPLVEGYLLGVRHALESVRGISDTPRETPTERVLAERDDNRRTT